MRFDGHNGHGRGSNGDGGAPVMESAGHDDALATVTLPTARKKSVERRFLVTASDQGWLARCARMR